MYMVIIYMVDKGDPFPSVSRKVPLDVSILSETKPSNFTKTSKSTIKTQPKPLFFYNPSSFFSNCRWKIRHKIPSKVSSEVDQAWLQANPTMQWHEQNIILIASMYGTINV